LYLLRPEQETGVRGGVRPGFVPSAHLFRRKIQA
jgi:hypothetical protein